VAILRIRLAEESDRISLAKMSALLWPEASFEEHLKDVDNAATSSTLPLTTLVAQDGTGELVGFLEVGLRSHADGCNPAKPVGFVEGWFVQETWRGRGVGRDLMRVAEEWARSHGCVEMASDTWIDSEGSQLAHTALGFEIVDRCVHFRKSL
jgi:aminoglycoside 6'-N-acetyltransferase I